MRSRIATSIVSTILLEMYGGGLNRADEQPQLAGIGVALKIEDGKVLVGTVVPDTPASQAKLLQPDDRILAVGEGDKEPVEVTGMAMAKLVDLIRGPKGTVVRLTIVPAGKRDEGTLVVSITRGELKALSLMGDGKLLPPGTKAPDIKFTRLLDDKEGSLSQYRGQIVVLEVWASWCKPCVADVEKLESLAAEHPEWNGRVELIAVSADEDRTRAAELWKAKHWNKIVSAWTGPSIFKTCHMRGFPGLFVIDPNGVVVESQPSGLAEVLRRLLSGDDG
jgi:thiol-disulfide isomerase/thioredoxin